MISSVCGTDQHRKSDRDRDRTRAQQDNKDIAWCCIEPCNDNQGIDSGTRCYIDRTSRRSSVLEYTDTSCHTVGSDGRKVQSYAHGSHLWTKKESSFDE